MTSPLTPEAIDAMFERMNPEPDTPSDLGNLTMFARERHARWEAKREGFRQAMWMWETKDFKVTHNGDYLPIPERSGYSGLTTTLYRLKEPT